MKIHRRMLVSCGHSKRCVAIAKVCVAAVKVCVATVKVCVAAASPCHRLRPGVRNLKVSGLICNIFLH
jgi:hypothetical protein